MTTQFADPNTQAGNASDSNSVQGGSPPGGNVGEGGQAEGAGDQEGGQTQEGAEGGNTQGEGSGSGQGDDGQGEGAGAGRVTELESELQTLRAESQQQDFLLSSIRRGMEVDPVLRARLEALSMDGSSQGRTSTGDLVETFREELYGSIKREAADGLLKAMTPILERMQEQDKVLRRLGPQMNEMSQSLGTRDYQDTLATRGIGDDVQKSKQFQVFTAALRNDPEFAPLLRGNQRAAARAVANEWIASRKQKGDWSADQSRLAGARSASRNGSNANGARGGSNVAQQVFKIVRKRDGSHIDEAHQARTKWQSAGKPGLPDIEYVDSAPK